MGIVADRVNSYDSDSGRRIAFLTRLCYSSMQIMKRGEKQLSPNSFGLPLASIPAFSFPFRNPLRFGRFLAILELANA